jgi:hypothetical protein
MNMKTKLVRVLSVIAASWLALALANSALAQTARSADYSKQPSTGSMGTSTSQNAKTTGAQGAKMATPITMEEALKKYPPPKSGSYPVGERDAHDPSGVVVSPYPPHDKFDCSNIKRGGLGVDTHVNKVFVRP